MPLTDYVGGLKGKNLSSGYVKVTAPREVAGFALFGTNKGTALAACPPNWEQPLQQEEMGICPTFRDEHFYGNQ